MNFPGLDPLWSGVHHAGRSLGVIRPWSLEGIRADQKILVVASTALGDSLLTTPLVETVWQHLGPGRVSLLVKAPYIDLYRGDPRLRRVFSVCGKYRWNHLRRELRADPHRIALLANITEPDLIPWLWHCGVRCFLRYKSRWTRFPRWMANQTMMRRPGDPDYATGHAIENNLAMAVALGLEPTTHWLSLPAFTSQTSPKENVLLIHPGASREIKQWAPERWARLGDTLAEKLGCEIALTGDSREAALARQVAMLMKSPAKVLAGTLGLPDLARLQARSLAFLSGDTGPYHLAVAVGCPTVTLFAPTDRGSSTEACGPHQADPVRHRSIQTAKIGDLIATISFEDVVRKAIDVVENSQRGAR